MFSSFLMIFKEELRKNEEVKTLFNLRSTPISQAIALPKTEIQLTDSIIITFKQAEGLVIIQPAKVVDITPPKPKSFDFKGDFFDRYYKEGWKDKDVKYSHGSSGDEDKIPDFLKYAIPMPMSQRRMDVSIHSVAKSPKMFGSSW